jgi:hypothetical protein
MLCLIGSMPAGVTALSQSVNSASLLSREPSTASCWNSGSQGLVRPYFAEWIRYANLADTMTNAVEIRQPDTRVVDVKGELQIEKMSSLWHLEAGLLGSSVDDVGVWDRLQAGSERHGIHRLVSRQ